MIDLATLAAFAVIEAIALGVGVTVIPRMSARAVHRELNAGAYDEDFAEALFRIGTKLFVKLVK